MQNKALILEAHHTTHIEGTQLTLEQSEQLWAGQHLASVNPDDTKELLNYRQAFDLVADYYQAIQSVRQQDMDMTGWVEYFVQGLSTQLQEVKSLGRQAIEHDVMAKQYHLSERQKLVIEYIAKHGGISIQKFEEICPDVTRRTLQRELKELIDKNILTTTGATSNLIYEMQVKSKQD